MPYYPPASSGGGSSAAPDYIRIVESQASNTNAGTFTSGAWQTRVLNSKKEDTGNNATLSSNQITLAAGTYIIYATAPTYAVSRHQARLYNVTDSSVIISGASEFSANNPVSTGRSVIAGRFTIAANKALEIQHQCETTVNTFGFGVGSGSAFAVTEEIFTIVELWKVA